MAARLFTTATRKMTERLRSGHHYLIRDTGLPPAMERIGTDREKKDILFGCTYLGIDGEVNEENALHAIKAEE